MFIVRFHCRGGAVPLPYSIQHDKLKFEYPQKYTPAFLPG